MIDFQRCRLTALSALVLGLIAGTSASAQYVNTERTCINCHSRSQTDFCQTIPTQLWEMQDKHAQAFKLFYENNPERANQILGFDMRRAFADASLDQLKKDQDPETVRMVSDVKSCLRCHATWPKEADQQDAYLSPVPLTLGVSCQACHGPAKEWTEPHELDAWRLATPAAKASLGFADCRSPAAKAELCASCHVGNVAEGKFVKHEWYAAGHPPLPSFELATFEEAMPQHWKSLREKGNFKFRSESPETPTGQFSRDLNSLKGTLRAKNVSLDEIKKSHLEANFSEALAKGLTPGDDLAAAKDAIVAGAVVFKTYVRQVGDYAGSTMQQEAAWPELALYDCTACHHELRRRLPVSVKQRRHPPGRPPLADWPQVLAKLAVYQAANFDHPRAAAEWDKLQHSLLQLEQAATLRPFGDRTKMNAAASAFAEALDAVVKGAIDTRYDRASATAALQVLTHPEFIAAYDFSSARQAAWALKAIAADAELPEAPKFFAGDAGEALSLNLPSGQDASVMANLRRWLPAAARFEPQWFTSELSTVRATLNKP